MKAIIPILRETIRPNPDYGKSILRVLGPRTCWFRLHDAPVDWVGKGLRINIPARGFSDGVTFATEMLEVDRGRGTLDAYCVALNSVLPEALEAERLPESVSRYLEFGIEREYIETVNTNSGKEFLYDHDEAVPVECSECGGAVPFNEIIEADFTDSEGDWRCGDQCPECGALHSFDYEYEKL